MKILKKKKKKKHLLGNGGTCPKHTQAFRLSHTTDIWQRKRPTRGNGRSEMFALKIPMLGGSI